MNVLVTGGAGYIGSHTCKELALCGHEPVTFDNLSMGHREFVKWGPLVLGDLTDQASLSRAFREYKIEAVVHFAANAYVGESMLDPMKYFRNNVSGSIALLSAMTESGVSKIVFSSSCATYGLPLSVPIAETHPTAPINPYGESKLAVERMLRWCGELKGFHWAALRYFNAAGADKDGQIGEKHNPETHIIPLALRAATPGSGETLSVFGTDYPTCDGSAVRDYIHVTDLARAHVAALDALKHEKLNEAINLGTGCGISVKQLLREIAKVTGNPVRFKELPRRAGDPPELVANAAKAAAILNWKPNRSDIRTIVEDAWAWEQHHQAER